MSISGHDHIILARAVSRLLGWIYTLCWSLSFYPQPILNFARRSTVGSTIDFPAINLLGFLFYFLSNSFLFYSTTIRMQYAARNPISPIPSVKDNDVVFAVHGVILSAITLSMFWEGLWGFKQSRGQRVSRSIVGLGLGCVAGVCWTIVMVLRHSGGDVNGWAWLDVIYALGYGKLVITVVKYVPQVWVNYKRQSTQGWSIGQILLDLAGGVLSIMQMLIDSSLDADWSGITGNPVKFGLGNVSIVFDIIFMFQHYVLYRGRDREESEENRGLLVDDDDVRS